MNTNASWCPSANESHLKSSTYQ